MTLPNEKNFCGGAFQDWLEVMLIDKCNGNCVWCIEQDGYRPTDHVDWKNLKDAIILTKKRNIILLGGEPTLYRDMDKIIKSLHMRRNIYITTNASRLNKKYIEENLKGIMGVNLSIHHYNIDINQKITGIRLDWKVLREAIETLHKNGAEVRMNCNLIKGYIDTKDEIMTYIRHCKDLGVDSIRFAELKGDKNNFIDIAKIFNHHYGLNDDPFTHGCHQNTTIDGMKVNFRQMCGLQTEMRIKPKNPEQPHKKEVLYYDGLIYQGWQKDRRYNMQSYEMKELLDKVSGGEVSPEEALTKIYQTKDGAHHGCVY